MKHLKEAIADHTKEQIINMFVSYVTSKGDDVTNVKTAEDEGNCCPPNSCGVCINNICTQC